jgi:hypothetical protein
MLLKLTPPAVMMFIGAAMLLQQQAPVRPVRSSNAQLI